MPSTNIRFILWGALFASTIIYLAILQVVPIASPEGGPLPIMLIVFGAAAVSAAGASVWLPAKLAKESIRALALGTEAAPNFGEHPAGTLIFQDSKSARAKSQGAVQTAFIVRMALREAVAVFGFVLGFLGNPLPTYIGFFAASWVLMIAAFPRASEDDAMIEAACGAKLV